ncbi:unnamed protein product [Diamesa hyperborea]
MSCNLLTSVLLLLGLWAVLIDGQTLRCPKSKKIVCYLSGWSNYRANRGTFSIDQIDPYLCTHIVYTFAGLDINGGMISLDIENDITRNKNYYKTISLKEQNPCLKVLIAIGGWNEGSEKYSLLAETEESRNEFAEQAMRFMVYYGFDGLDIDWEYPTLRGGIKEDKENFVKLVLTLKRKFSKRNKLVTAALGATTTYIRESYNLAPLCKALDLIFIMSYDFHELNRTSINAPLSRENGQDSNTETIAENLNIFLEQGCEPEKLIMGIPTYGRTYTLKDPNENYVGAFVDGLGDAGPYTMSDGSLGFNEICEQLSQGNWTVKHLIKNASKVAFKGKQWISYDDPETVYQKTAFAMERGLGGVMFWTMDTDDFRGSCYNIKYPLINTASKFLIDYFTPYYDYD